MIMTHNTKLNKNNATTNAAVIGKKNQTSTANKTGHYMEMDSFQDNSGNASMLLTRESRTSMAQGNTGIGGAANTVTRTTSGGAKVLNSVGHGKIATSSNEESINIVSRNAGQGHNSGQYSAKKSSITTSSTSNTGIVTGGIGSSGMHQRGIGGGEGTFDIQHAGRMSGGAGFSNSGGASFASGSGGPVTQSSMNKKVVTEYNTSTGFGNLKDKTIREEEALGSTTKVTSRTRTMKIETSGMNTSGNDILYSAPTGQESLGDTDYRFSMDVARGGRSASPNILGNNGRASSRGQVYRTAINTAGDLPSPLLAGDKRSGTSKSTKVKKKITSVVSSSYVGGSS